MLAGSVGGIGLPALLAWGDFLFGDGIWVGVWGALPNTGVLRCAQNGEQQSRSWQLN